MMSQGMPQARPYLPQGRQTSPQPQNTRTPAQGMMLPQGRQGYAMMPIQPQLDGMQMPDGRPMSPSRPPGQGMMMPPQGAQFHMMPHMHMKPMHTSPTYLQPVHVVHVSLCWKGCFCACELQIVVYFTKRYTKTESQRQTLT
jgi:hypothetical protein